MSRRRSTGRTVAERTAAVLTAAVLAAAIGAAVDRSSATGRPARAASVNAGSQQHQGSPAPTAPARTPATDVGTRQPPATAGSGHPAGRPHRAVLLQYGSTGRAVWALQRRLASLGYWVGPPDGVFGDSTQQAVFALQKAAGLSRDGVVGERTAAALARGVRPQPRPAPGYVVEVDLRDDLVMIVDNGRLLDILNTSTGGGYTYTSDGVTSVAETPVGHFKIYRQVDGMVVDSLGALWRPKYFYSGFAIHGDSDVPAEPVSHGCVRVSNEAIDWIWANNVIPVGTQVWVYS